MWVLSFHIDDKFLELTSVKSHNMDKEVRPKIDNSQPNFKEISWYINHPSIL